MEGTPACSRVKGSVVVGGPVARLFMMATGPRSHEAVSLAMHEHADEHRRARRSQQKHDSYATHGSSSHVAVASGAAEVRGSSRGLRGCPRRFWLAEATCVVR